MVDEALASGGCPPLDAARRIVGLLSRQLKLGCCEESEDGKRDTLLEGDAEDSELMQFFTSAYSPWMPGEGVEIQLEKRVAGCSDAEGDGQGAGSGTSAAGYCLQTVEEDSVALEQVPHTILHHI